MSPPSYSQVEGLALYALSTAGDSGVPGYWAGYLPSAQAQFGPTATLDEVWQDAGGAYLFAAATATSMTAFAAGLAAVWPKVSPTGGVRFAWLSNPEDPPAAWQLTTLQARATGAGAQIAWAVSRQAVLVLGGYAVGIATGAALTQATMLGSGIQIDAGHVTFTAPGGGYTAQPGTAWLPLAGPFVGGIAATLALDDGAATPDDLAQLQVQLRYALRASDDPDETGIVPVPLPVLAQAGANLTLYLAYDPLHPLLPARSQLGFFPASGAGSAPALAASFATTRGYTTTLTPVTGQPPLWNARLVFNASPLTLPASAGEAAEDYYLTPDGAFQLATQTPAALRAQAVGGAPEDRLTLGLSGLEYAGLPSGDILALFVAGQPAFAPSARRRPGAPGGGDADAPPLTALATTSYVALLPATSGAAGLTYYAQPRQAPLYTAGGGLGAGFLGYHEMRAAILPSFTSGGATPAALPMAGYRMVALEEVELARALEDAALAPARRAAVLPPVELRAAEDATPPLAVTPVGLVAVLSADQTQWAGVVVANLLGAEVPLQTFTQVGGPLQAALQSNQLFFVVSNVDAFMAASSVAYQLTAATLPLLAGAGVPAATITALGSLLAAMSPPYPVFPTESAFVAAVGTTAGAYLPQVLALAGQLRPVIDGWTFQLSPRSWRADPAAPTIMMFKYCNRSLEEMVADGGAWGWPAAAANGSGSITATQRAIQRVLAAAADAPPDSAYARFYREVVSNRAWNGVLFLNAPVDLAAFPQELQFLAAGLDPARFYAHHVGFSLTPFSAGATISLGQTAVFGLIDYQDTTDLSYASSIPFAFKTLALRARFANAALAEMSAQVELMVNQLFGSALAKEETEHGNNLILDGSYQRQNGAPSYSFVLRGDNVFAANSSALASVEVIGVQLLTTTGTSAGEDVSVGFVLSGNLRFIQLSPFDVFSYGVDNLAGTEPIDGWLRFGNLAIEMTFALATPTQQQFGIAEGSLRFDLANSMPRPRSLAARFPVSVTSLEVSPNLAEAGQAPKGQSPEDLGFTPVTAPLDQSKLVPPWYGLVFSINLGTLGALVGSLGLELTMLAGWAAGAGDQLPVYVGLGLPGGRSLGVDWPLQGVLRLGFRSIQFSVDESDYSYMIRLRRLALSVLVWSFPPGNIDVFIFGDRAAIGWYAAYAQKPAKPASKEPRLPSGSPQRLLEAGKEEADPEETPQTRGGERLARRAQSGRRNPVPRGGR